MPSVTDRYLTPLTFVGHSSPSVFPTLTMVKVGFGGRRQREVSELITPQTQTVAEWVATAVDVDVMSINREGSG